MIHAEVAGTQLYETSVWIEDGEAAGTCNCPSAEDGWFCKHQVAVALIWRHRLSGTEPVIDEAARKNVQASAKRAQTVKHRREALEEFLRSQPATLLAEKLIDLADSYHEIERELQQWQMLTNAEPEDLKPLVNEILAVGQRFLPLPEVYGYVWCAAAVLPVLQGARQRDVKAAVALSLHAPRPAGRPNAGGRFKRGDRRALSRHWAEYGGGFAGCRSASCCLWGHLSARAT